MHETPEFAGKYFALLDLKTPEVTGQSRHWRRAGRFSLGNPPVASSKRSQRHVNFRREKNRTECHCRDQSLINALVFTDFRWGDFPVGQKSPSRQLDCEPGLCNFTIPYSRFYCHLMPSRLLPCAGRWPRIDELSYSRCSRKARAK